MSPDLPRKTQKRLFIATKMVKKECSVAEPVEPKLFVDLGPESVGRMLGRRKANFYLY